VNLGLFLLAVAVVAAFGIAELIGPANMTERLFAQNMTGDNSTMMGSSNLTVGNMTGGGNWTK
jgi:hypothetical protein